VDEPAADIGEQSEKPENCDDNSDPKQHEFLLHCYSLELLHVQSGAFIRADRQEYTSTSHSRPPCRFRSSAWPPHHLGDLLKTHAPIAW
jgi:hypothetical protein